MLHHRHFFLFCFLVFFTSKANAVTLTSGQTDFVTSGNITTNGIGISSSLVGTASSLDKIKNLHIITTGNSGTVSSAYGIRTSGNFNQITNAIGASIFTTGSSGRGISVTNNSVVFNQGNISTLGTTSYGIYSGGNNNAITNSGTISTVNTTSYGIYLNGDNNSATNSGSINTKVYGIYSDGNINQISNSGTIATTESSSAHGIFSSAGSSSTASASSFSTINNSGNINSSGNGIYVKDNFTLVINSGTITSAVGSSISGIRNEGDNSTINNFGDINSSNFAIYNSGVAAVINNSGNLNGGVRIGSGTLNIFSGSINGIVDGVARAGNINIGDSSHPTVIFNQSGNFQDINDLSINANSTLNSAAAINANRILIDDNAVLNLNSGSSMSSSIQGVSDSFGSLNIFGNSFASNGIGISGASLKNLNIASGASAAVTNDIYASNIFLSGNLDFSGGNNLNIFGNLDASSSASFNIGSQNQKINGNFSLSSNAILAVALKNNGVGSLDIRGITTIDQNAKLQISTSVNQNYIPNGTSYVLINAASGSNINQISSNNISVNSSNSNISGLLHFTTLATPNSLVLNINHLAASEITSSQNAGKIYQTVNSLGASSSGKLLQFQQFLDSSNLNSDDLEKTLKQLSAQSTKATLATINNVALNSMVISEKRLEKHKLGDNQILKNNLWGQVFGSSMDQEKIKDDDGYNSQSGGIAFGADKELFDETRIGGALTYAHSAIKNSDNSKQNLIETFQANIYASKNFEKYFLDGIFGAAFHSLSSNRSINATGSNATAQYSAETLALKIKSGVENKFGHHFKITPEISLNFLHNEISGYSEKGADDLNLKVSKVSANFLETRAGINFSYKSNIHDLPEFQRFAGIFKISYGYALINDAPTTRASFAQYGSGFDAKISQIDKSSLKLGFEGIAIHKENTTFSLDYQFEQKATSTTHFITAKIRQEF